ncbi:AAA family ATPase [Microbacterium sediminis]|uniref:ATP-binding protein n=1 Tax=Microbacterium sediminis TaxID=904291 RepID=A0A1B9NB60_9MICO|nr:AAA family ATPase [Microbacterium sediminis]OCG73813.1 ATP-binding protein [Microbacterium sediminis]QBR74558.1 ATP-binding protein [Microbacterium sediminis]
MITTLAVAGYRSLVDLVVPLGRTTVVTGGNGTGKSSLYRSLRLLAAAAGGSTIATLAAEGGLASALWAGPEVPGAQTGTVRRRPVSLRLGFAADELGYLVDLGLPQIDSRSLFVRDAEIKREQVFAGPLAKPATTFVDRGRAGVRVREDAWRSLPSTLAPHESILTDVADADASQELLSLRRTLASWRFYDHFRTDRDAPARQPQVSTRVRHLAHDGADLAAAWASAEDAGIDLQADVSAAFPGSGVVIDAGEDGRFRLRMRQRGLLRPLEAAELSDGTLRYLLLIAALRPARPAPFLVLNEPESSLHPDLLAPLAALVREASGDTQVLVVTHAARLASALVDAGADGVELVSSGEGTRIAGQGMLDAPPWRWPSR